MYRRKKERGIDKKKDEKQKEIEVDKKKGVNQKGRGYIKRKKER